ncbi:MAG: mannose-1-phosphate guanylyltransferase/mannose-6-phosphate isomerase [Deltaproteobacteria bacterium]|jgi:mannose-1-phosphate guanylyltransferase|nr:mannose-1-phosphate guanylyltransferase/mannose-6-phosphate isomerase [Deltaproteobacteria bacterium]
MICVVLCGGAGSRLWPLSRQEHPKPFITLPGGKNLLQTAYLHASKLSKCQEIVTVTNKELYFKAAEAMRSLDLPVPASFILEPAARNTAPAIAAAAAAALSSSGPGALVLVLAADHLISNQRAFEAAVNEASSLAGQGFLATFGLKPTRPETGFGYIEAEGSRVLSFVEKPDLETAKRYLASGSFYWNAGLCCFKTGALIEIFKKVAPEIYAKAEESFQSAKKPSKFANVTELNPDIFASIPSISFDYAVLEKTDKVAMVPCDLGWSDIGTWSALSELYPEDESGNHLFNQKTAILSGASDCDVYSEDRLVACLGLANTLIVDTADAVLVADKSKVQDVRLLYDEMKSRNSETFKRHRTVYKPWGSFTLLGEGPRFKIKRLVIKPGGSLSLQMHRHRSEHWVVVSGSAEVVCGDEVFFVDTNESTYIKAGHFHRVSNKGLIDLIIIEVQSGDYLEEDDIIRSDDAYGRA